MNQDLNNMYFKIVKPLRWLCLTLFFAIASVAVGAANPPAHAVLPIDQGVGGESRSALTVRWWQWAASFQYAESPVSDKTGERCGAGQEGEVWFLAGTYGSAPTSRTCTVPAGKHLFFPLINYVVMPQNCSGCLTCKAAVETAAKMTDGAMGLFAELDGKSLPSLTDHRVTSGQCFNLSARAVGSPPIQPSASDGYWLLLPPLTKGRHTLRFGGSLPSLRQELIYTLEVK